METKVAGFSSRGVLSVVQLTTGDQNTFEYISSGAAIKRELIAVKELNEGGVVNTLMVINNSDHFVFFMDGDILAGAKQNRVLNTSLLLAPQSKTQIPVSCVEQGRWRHVSPGFSSTDYVAPVRMRSSKAHKVTMNLKQNLGFVADQGEVWEGVASYSAASGVESRTSNLSDVYEKRRAELERFVESFKPTSGANGVAFFLGQDLVNIDLFNRTDVFSEYLPKMVRGIGLEALGLTEGRKSVPEAEAKFRVLDLLDKVGEVKTEVFPGAGAGEEKRFEVEQYAGFELGYGQQRIHTAVLRGRSAPRRA